MKKLFLLTITFLVCQFNYSQKKELKSVDKLLKSGDFIEAKASLELISNMITTSDDKTKAKFYYLKGLSNYQNGDASFENKRIHLMGQVRRQTTSQWEAEIYYGKLTSTIVS